MAKKRKEVMFSTDGKGHWWRREWAQKCPEKVFFGRHCQGVEGHKGVHWCYGEDGSLHWDDNELDPQEDGCSGTTPPGHPSYITPLKMSKKLWLNHFTDSEVTDPDELDRLEREETRPGECITCPAGWKPKRKKRKK